MTDLDTYQRAAIRTVQNAEAVQLVLELVTEAAEVADLHKKARRKGIQPDRNRIKDELGDVLWGVATLAAAHGLTLSEVAAYNVSKLVERYPFTR